MSRGTWWRTMMMIVCGAGTLGKSAFRKLLNKTPCWHQNSVSHPLQPKCASHFSTTESWVLRSIVLFVSGCLPTFSLVFGLYRIRSVDVLLEPHFLLKLVPESPVVVSVNPNGQIPEWFSYFCSLTELFTLNKLALYCTKILYLLAVYDTKPLSLIPWQKAYTRRRNISVLEGLI